MRNIFCILMGFMDIIAGIIILILLFSYPLAIVLCVGMIGKGIMSLGFFGK